MKGSLLLPVDGLDVGSLDKEEGQHLKVAIVGSMVEGSLPSAITNVQVTKTGDQDLC